MSFTCPGYYGGVIKRTELVRAKGDGQSRSFSLFVEIDEFWWSDRDPPAFDECEKFDAEIPNWIVKKDGSLNDKTVERLATTIGFDGVESDYIGQRVRVTVEEEEYKGKKTPKPKWLNNADWLPGASSYAPVDDAEKKQFSQDFGSKIRALTARPGGAPVPTNRPTAPLPARAARPAPQPVPAGAEDEPGSHDGEEEGGKPPW